MHINQHLPKAFTLIELLIVVAIIAILAAIAVPNFLEAQTRSKVTRSKADLRTMILGLESYRVDLGTYPREYLTGSPYGDPSPDGNTVDGIVWTGLSTPVAYLSNAWIIDVFAVGRAENTFHEEVVTYYNSRFRVEQVTPGAYWEAAREYWGEWQIIGYGPDRDFENLEGNFNTIAILYDPTNGTISQGNIWVSQRNSGIQPPQPSILLP
jgi:prepilin-type N-terminal cleavage/methylation domain-containing protein